MSVAPTSAMPSGPPGVQPITRRAPARVRRVTRRLAWVTGGVIVQNLPAGRPLLHDQSKGAAGGDASAPLEDEPSRYQRQRAAQGPDLDLLEVQAVPPCPRRKAWGIVLANELEPVPGSSSVDKGGGALWCVVRQERLEIPAVPISGRPIELGLHLPRESRAAHWRTGNRHRLPGRPACHHGQNQDVQVRTHDYE